MPSRSIPWLIISLVLAGCDPATRPATTQPATRDPGSRVAADELRELPAGDVVFSRNLQRLGGEYDVLAGQYGLGTACVRRPPPWWREIAEGQKLEAQATIFPLVFVGRWTSEAGAERLVVLQMRHRFDGDGFFTPGPTLRLAAYVFERTPSGKWSRLWSDENACYLHTMQNARFLAGRWEQKPRTIALKIEQRDRDGRMRPTGITGTISPEGKISISPAGNY